VDRGLFDDDPDRDRDDPKPTVTTGLPGGNGAFLSTPLIGDGAAEGRGEEGDPPAAPPAAAAAAEEEVPSLKRKSVPKSSD
jgi:hypothetical protein